VGFRWQNFGKNYYFDYNVRIVAKQERLSDSFLVLNGGPEPGFVSHISAAVITSEESDSISVSMPEFRICLGVFTVNNRNCSGSRGSFTIGTTWELK
jgi:hypothetical protein